MANSSNSWLKGKRVLVTRPERQAQGLATAIMAQGGEVLRCPVLSIEPIAATEASKQKVINLDQYDDLVFVSSNAVTLGLEKIEDYWPQLPAHLRWFAVGKSTAACLEDKGIKVILPSNGFNSEALLQLPDLQQLANRRTLIFKGEGGRELLAQCLTERGAQVDALLLYRREPVSYSSTQLQALFSAGLPDVLIATSVDVLHTLDAMLNSYFPSYLMLPLVVASGRIAGVAKDLGYHRVITADSAADGSIVKALNVIR